MQYDGEILIFEIVLMLSRCLNDIRGKRIEKLSILKAIVYAYLLSCF